MIMSWQNLKQNLKNILLSGKNVLFFSTSLNHLELSDNSAYSKKKLKKKYSSVSKSTRVLVEFVREPHSGHWNNLRFNN